MFKKMTKPELVTLTPEMAKRLLIQNTFGGQRRHRPFWVNYLANKMKQDRFTTGSIALAYHNGGAVMVNGQHQCMAVLQSGKKVYALFEKYLCPDKCDVSELYREFDSHLPRSLTDVVQVEIKALGFNWPKELAARIASAGAVANAGFPRGLNVTKDIKVETIQNYSSIGHQIVKLHSEGAREFKHLNKGPIIAAMIMTNNKCQRDWPSFWVPVKDGDNLKKSDPRKQLRDYLIVTSMRGGSTNNGHSVTYKEMLSRSITAWNAYREGKTTSLRYYPNRPVPPVL